MINELSAAAVKEIETAAGEAAKAAALAALEREAVHLAEIERLRKTNRELKKRDIKIIVITGLACFVSGAIFGGIMSSEE
jgi:anti-sigma factor RsiW